MLYLIELTEKSFLFLMKIIDQFPSLINATILEIIRLPISFILIENKRIYLA